MAITATKDLEILDIRDAGSQNERLLLRAINPANLSDYLVINSKLNERSMLNLLNEHVYWFQPGITVNKGDIVRLYTRRTGGYESSRSTYGDEQVQYHDFHWGLSNPVWDGARSDTATVVHISTWSSFTKRDQ